MKYLFILFLVCFNQVWAKDMLNDSFIKSNRGNFKYPKNELALKEFEFERILETNRNIALKLGSIKYEIINGNLEKAKILLLQSKYSDDFSRSVQYRYLGIINFIQGNFKKSQEFLTNKYMYNISTDDTICLLRTLNYTILNELSKASIEWARCKDVTINKSPTSHLWMNTILKLKLNDEKEITLVPLKKINIENERGDFLRLYLKMALYLNQQQKIFDRLSYLSVAAYEDPEIRELIGLLYYREGKLAKSYEFVEDLTSPNSENMKGNLYLTQKKYELAYGQFKLALKKKVNSQNALERLIPIAWILKQWDDGLEFLSKLNVDPKDKYSRLTLEAAFLTQSGRYAQAEKILKQIVQESHDAQSTEVNQLYSYNALMLKDKYSAETYADKSCQYQDGINCWLQFHLVLWENFPLMIHRDEQIYQESTNISKEYLASYTADPFKEDLFVNQKDIEELDNDIIMLLPKNQN